MARTAPDADVALETLPDRPAASAAATGDPDQGVSTPMSTTLNPHAETPTPHHTAPEVPLGSISVHPVPLPTPSPQRSSEPRCSTLPCLSNTLTSPTTQHDQVGTCTGMVPPSGARDDAASSTLQDLEHNAQHGPSGSREVRRMSFGAQTVSLNRILLKLKGHFELLK